MPLRACHTSFMRTSDLHDQVARPRPSTVRSRPISHISREAGQFRNTPESWIGDPWTILRPGGLTNAPAIGRVRFAPPPVPVGIVSRLDVAALT